MEAMNFHFCWENGDSMHWYWDSLAKKTIENGNVIMIRTRQPVGLSDLCIWTLGFSQNIAGKWEEAPLFRTMNYL